MDLLRAERLAKDLIRYYAPEFKFKWDKASRRFGLCEYISKTISISKKLAVLNSETEVLNTILHEVAHAVIGFEDGHNETWQAKAVSIGCDGKRLYDANTVIRPGRTFVGVCPGCKRQVSRFRRKRISCGKCGNGEFNSAYLFVWRRSLESEGAV